MTENYTDWVEIVGGILKHAGVPGFLANLDELQEQADEESAEWEAFLLAWHACLGDAWKTTADVSDALPNASDAKGTHLFAGVCDELAGVCNENPLKWLFDTLPEWLQVALKDKPNSFKMRLGRALEKRVDACFGAENLRLEKTVEKHSKKVLWRVLRGFAGLSSQLREGENLERSSAPETEPKIACGIVGIKPPQTPASEQSHEEQMVKNGSTGGSTVSCNQEVMPKTDQKPQNANQTPANETEPSANVDITEEREVFTL